MTEAHVRPFVELFIAWCSSHRFVFVEIRFLRDDYRLVLSARATVGPDRLTGYLDLHIRFDPRIGEPDEYTLRCLCSGEHEYDELCNRTATLWQEAFGERYGYVKIV